MLREDLIKSVKEGDTLTIRQLRNTTIVFPQINDEQTFKSKLLTSRENILLQFFMGEYDKLLFDMRVGADYILTSKKLKKGYLYPNFDCGNLTLELLGFWKNQSAEFIAKIGKSTITIQEKELLLIYWESILLYIEGEKTLSPEINTKAAQYLDKYPDTKYRDFLERLTLIQKVYRPNGMSLGLGFGKSYPTGKIDNYLRSDIAFDFEVGYTFRGWHLRLGYRYHTFNYTDTMLIKRIDTLTINQSSYIEYHGFVSKISYTIIDKDWFKIQPFISGEFNKFVNYIDLPDTTGIRQKGKTHPIFGIGTEGAIRLIKNLINNNQSEYLYFPREEKDLFYNPVFLNFRLGYYPNIFNKPTGINGSIFYWTVGLEWIIGSNQAYYKHVK